MGRHSPNLVRSLLEKAREHKFLSGREKMTISALSDKFDGMLEDRKATIRSQFRFLPLDEIVAFYDMSSGDRLFLTTDGDVLRYSTVTRKKKS